MRYRIAALPLTLALAALPARSQDPPAAPEPPPETAATPEELEQRVRILERQLELAAERQAEQEKGAPRVVAGPEGFALRSANGDFQIRLRGYVQLDGRAYFDDEELPANDTFVVRRARPIVEGTVYKIFDFRVMPDFGGGQSVLQDAYVEARFSKAARLRAGKFKPPLGLERLQSATDLVFVERAGPTLLVPNRDLGLQLAGDLAGGRLEYAAGLFNGVIDGGVGDTASTDGKEVVARLFWRPFQSADGVPPAVDLGIGLAASRGEQEGSVSSPQLPAYRTIGQQVFFSYRSDGTAAGTTIAEGDHERWVPQAWLYSGPFGLLLEYAGSRQGVRRDAEVAELAHTAWQIQASWVLTGERNGYRGIAPRSPFDPTAEGRGAWIVAARYSAFDADGDSFPMFADPARSASAAELVSLGVSWNLARGLRWMLDYDWIRFEGGGAGGDRPDEKVFLTRFQVAF